MKVLVIGSGGREHALVWKLSRSPSVTRIYAAPGSDAIGRLARCVDIQVNDIEALASFAHRERIDLTMVGPEEPLICGVVDLFQSKGLPIVGPTAAAARLEGSKAFSKQLMKKYGIPSADFRVAKTVAEARNAIKEIGIPLVIKADGLAAGKGVILCYTPEEADFAIQQMMVDKFFGPAGDQVIIEQLLTGEEASFIALTDGRTVVPMASSQDHKRAFDNDEGPNTGGMGAYSPAPVVNDSIHLRIMEEVMAPIVEAMEAEGCPFSGVLYAGLMIKNNKPSILEFNCRFGDPETQPIMVRLRSDLGKLLMATANGKLDQVRVDWNPRPAVCVVMASGGYPGSAKKGYPISGIESVENMDDLVVFHAGTKLVDGQWTNHGGRVLGVTGVGDTIEKAIAKAYAGVNGITWQDAQFRKDIAHRALGRM